MSRVRRRRLYWDPPADTDVVDFAVYARAPDFPDFLATVDAGLVEPHEVVTDPEYFLDNLPEGDYQFAVCARDDAGNWSDPYQHPAWVNVPLDVTPPGPVSGGGLETL